MHSIHIKYKPTALKEKIQNASKNIQPQYIKRKVMNGKIQEKNGGKYLYYPNINPQKARVISILKALEVRTPASAISSLSS
jgi:phage pi2 protein 07